MGAVYQTVLIDLDAAVSTWGSRDDALHDRVRRDDAPRYVKHLLDRPERRGALAEILRGGACDLGAPHDYHYAFEALCFALGEPLEEVDARDVYRAESLAAGVETFTRFVSDAWPVPLPASHEPPFVGTRSLAECAAWAASLDRAIGAVDGRALDRWEAQQGFDALLCMRRHCARALDAGRDVIVFLH